MCGITGVYAFTDRGKANLVKVDVATSTLLHRGPDGIGAYIGEKIGLGHSRLAVIDPRSRADQPLADRSNRFHIIANAEIYNHNSLRAGLQKDGVQFRTRSDTEVILQLFIQKGAECLPLLNGFFAFAIYDAKEDTLFVARDRFGVKPLLVYCSRHLFCFASEMKALLAMGIPKDLDEASLIHYLQMNYIPQPHTIFKKVKKLSPGHYLQIKGNKIVEQNYYQIPIARSGLSDIGYEDAKKGLRSHLSQSVELRMQADFSVGVLLSGGIDSSVLVAEAARKKRNLDTFSIGFKDFPFFDESEYAQSTATKFATNHHAYLLSGEELSSYLPDFLESVDEPFADSSALLMYILSKKASDHVKVVLSGDGADELLGGYHRHRAHYFALHYKMLSNLLSCFSPLLQAFPKSNHSKLTDVIRQLHRFGQNCGLSPKERYWRWATVCNEKSVTDLLRFSGPFALAEERKDCILSSLTHPETLRDILYTDMKLILPGDMLYKVDSMSMANGLEVRTPYLDYTLVNFLFSLPDSYKMRAGKTKRLLKDAYASQLPGNVLKRRKKGFEVPLLQWLRNEMKEHLAKKYLNEELLHRQRIFNVESVRKMVHKLYSSHPEGVYTQLWAIIVFQHWWQKYMP